MIKKNDWKVKEVPDQKVDLGFKKVFSNSDASRLLRGYKPTEMEDKWFIYSEDSWVYFVRSWTGYYIFGIELSDNFQGEISVISSWVNGNNEIYRSQGRGRDIDVLNGIINSKFGVDVST
ncbi:hypothetical protein L1D09_13430 [Vibrio tubiashii]|uniref:hypothetical protein n=2 Tax=Vibrio tubiashii TaxID=29498 RepID=UPI001EFE94E3|nr:hypothetical protein [Vibrio tubiashii]MCG9582534.1 hypothetical protein [Vibrio tubiashii]MCG9616125.1 hypothetical protein [Vibrio tubiashii]